MRTTHIMRSIVQIESNKQRGGSSYNQTALPRLAPGTHQRNFPSQLGARQLSFALFALFATEQEGSMANVSFLLSLCAEFLQSEDQTRARQLYATLAESVDPIRSKYWTMKADKITA